MLWSGLIMVYAKKKISMDTHAIVIIVLIVLFIALLPSEYKRAKRLLKKKRALTTTISKSKGSAFGYS